MNSFVLDEERRLIAEHYTFVDDIKANLIACNLTRGREGSEHSEITKAKMSEARRKWWATRKQEAFQ